MGEKILILIPAFNEELKIREVIKDLKVHRFSDIAVVDDGSFDGTASVVRDLNTPVISHCVNMGKGAALKTGFSYAFSHDYDYIITCDADGQHLGKDVAFIAHELVKHRNTVIIGSRFCTSGYLKKQIPFNRKMFSIVAYFLSYILTTLPLTDSQSGLRGYSVSHLKSMDLQSCGMAIDTEILIQLHKKNVAIKEVPIEPVYTQYSLSKGQSFVKGVETLYKLLIRFL